jgi:hypothetical protein
MIRISFTVRNGRAVRGGAVRVLFAQSGACSIIGKMRSTRID